MIPKLSILLCLLLFLPSKMSSNLEQWPADFKGETIIKTVTFDSSNNNEMRDFVTVKVNFW